MTAWGGEGADSGEGKGGMGREWGEVDFGNISQFPAHLIALLGHKPATWCHGSKEIHSSQKSYQGVNKKGFTYLTLTF